MDCTVRHNCKNVCIKKRLEGGGGWGFKRGRSYSLRAAVEDYKSTLGMNVASKR